MNHWLNTHAASARGAKAINTAFPQKKALDSESGMVLLLLALFCAILIGALALVLDLGRSQVAVRQLQNAADAAALAAAGRLSGTQAGWAEAKKAAVASIRRAEIHGIPTHGLKNVRFAERYELNGTIDRSEPQGSDYRATSVAVTNATISIERGAYWSNKDGSGYEFVSFEKAGQGKVNGEPLPMRHGLPVYMIANAVRVTIKLAELPTFFTGVFGYRSVDGLERSAVGVAEAPNDDVCVFPAAIPACQLLLDINPEHNNQFQTDEYKPLEQCQRDFVATEANAKGLDYARYRAAGMLRSEWYPRPPYVRYTGNTANICGVPGEGATTALNCKALPMYGVLGRPVAPNDPQAKSALPPDSLAQVLNSSQICLRGVRLGSRFRPLENGAGPSGFLNAYGQSVRQNLANFINENARQLDEVLGPATNPKANFPALRDAVGELLVQWPMENSNGMNTLQLAQMGAWHFTNPMCHDPLIAGDHATRHSQHCQTADGQPAPAARGEPYTRKVRLMVIASKDQQYCDFAKVFEGTVPNVVAPEAASEPIVVGFVDAEFFDFNITPLKDSDACDGGVSTRDKNPASIAAASWGTSHANNQRYIQELREWYDCVNCRRCTTIEPRSPQGCNPQCPPLSSCPSEPVRPVSKPSAIPQWVKDCFDLDTYEDNFSGTRHSCVDGEQAGYYDPDRNQWVLTDCSDLDDWLLAVTNREYDFLKAKEKCFPQKVPGCFPTTDPACWGEPAVTPPQYGCGGMRMRLDCAVRPGREHSNVTLITPTPLDQVQAALVK